MHEMNEHQQYEAEWWGACANTFSEEAKQITYAYSMGLVNEPDSYTGRWPQYDMQGKTVLDIGGGPVSMLLKCVNLGPSVVIDPCPYPGWVKSRYEDHGVEMIQVGAEEYLSGRLFDEVWIYNVLQHVEDPLKVLATARAHSYKLRIFEWIDTPPCLGHPHTITKAMLDEFLRADGTTAFFDGSSNSVWGDAYFGAFDL